jgi:hypothetical protein
VMLRQVECSVSCHRRDKVDVSRGSDHCCGTLIVNMNSRHCENLATAVGAPHRPAKGKVRVGSI